jgi:hypothetical protein
VISPSSSITFERARLREVANALEISHPLQAEHRGDAILLSGALQAAPAARSGRRIHNNAIRPSFDSASGSVPRSRTTAPETRLNMLLDDPMLPCAARSNTRVPAPNM